MHFSDLYENEQYINHMYITENIPTDGTTDLFQEIFSEGCKCDNICNAQNCSCLQKYGTNYSIKRNNSKSLDKNCMILNYSTTSGKLHKGLYECNSNCKCVNQFCGNRLVQNGPINHLEIKNCLDKGKGLFTTEKISKGTFICEYAGEVITESEALKRYKCNTKNNLMNYILCVKEHFGTNQTVTFIDPAYFGNIGRYANHSCDPNCELIPIRVNNTVPKLCIFAKTDINKNNELTFDYGDSTSTENDKKYDLKPCLCGENSCRKWLPFSPEICQ